MGDNNFIKALAYTVATILVLMVCAGLLMVLRLIVGACR